MIALGIKWNAKLSVTLLFARNLQYADGVLEQCDESTAYDCANFLSSAAKKA